VKCYVSALVGVIIKVILQNARCNNKDNMQTLYDTESAIFSVFECRCYSFHFPASITVSL